MVAVPQARTRPRAGLMTLLIAYSGFILLGLVDGVVGVAWPSMQATFGVALDAMGLFLLPGTLAYTVVSLVSGRLISGLGVGLFMLIGTGVRVLGLAGVGLAGLGGAAFWGLTLLIYAGVGVGASAIDTGFNNYVSANYSAGRLSWLHACFGLGATLGPLLMSTILNNGGVWQTGYLIVGGLHAILLVALLLVASH